ncbi:perforin-1-like [Poecilia reticulata]|uniref:perforin-1-like n=1 Tax=Poecilia reticulata TaxID=8081 RepID=UPI0007EB4E6C|nr:PREDICTED: perforin-1-like [Poecilia reticulata]
MLLTTTMLPDSTSALLLLGVLLVNSSVLSCRIGTQTECDAAPFVPGHNLLGQSFDISTLERKSAHVIDVKTYLTTRNTCILCSNPLQNDTLQKLPSSVVDFHAIPRCNPEIHSSFHTSASSLVQAYTSQDANDWAAGLEIEKFLFDNFDVGGTGSNIYKFVSQKIKEDRYTFSIHSVTCNHYGIILSTTPPLSLEFKQQLDLLPSHYNYSTKNEYRKFIQTYGTHYFRMVNLGGRLRRVTSSRSCLSSMNRLTSTQVHSCLSMGVAVGLGKEQLSSVQKSCISVLKNQDSATNFSSGLHQHFTEVSGGNGWLGEFSIFQNDSMGYMNWLKSLKEQPDVVSYSLQPLYKLIPSKQQEEMKAAIEHYLEDNALWNLPEEPHCDMTPNVASNCCPQHASRGTLSVTIVRGWGLFGDYIGPGESYAKMYYGSFQGRTKILDHSNPRWNTEFKLGMVDTSLPLLIQVWEDDVKYDDLLVQCRRYLIPGSHTFKCSEYYGNVETKYTLTCEPYVTGEKCSRYKPSPLETDDW